MKSEEVLKRKMFNGENVFKNVSILPWCRYKLLDIVSGQINNKTVKNSDHTVEKISL